MRPFNDRRSGITLFEVVIAVAAFGILLATCVKMMVLLSRQSRADDERNIAIQSVQAVLEQVENSHWDQLTQETANQVPLPEAATARLKDAKLTLTVSDEPSLSAKRISAALDWQAPDGDRSRPVRLVAWVFPDAPAPATQASQ
jgi:hypothetical protein